MENRRRGIKGKLGFYGPSLLFPKAPGGQVAKPGLAKPSLAKPGLAKPGLGPIPRFPTALPEGTELSCRNTQACPVFPGNGGRWDRTPTRGTEGSLSSPGINFGNFRRGTRVEDLLPHGTVLSSLLLQPCSWERFPAQNRKEGEGRG